MIFSALPLKCRQAKALRMPSDKSKMLINYDAVVNASSFELSNEQLQAIQAINDITGFGGVLLHGVTGSGKTEYIIKNNCGCP